MEPINLRETEISPAITLDKENNIFLLQGKSFMENPKAFYAPVKEWIADYISYPNKKTVFDISLDYLNSATLKSLLRILQYLQKLNHGSYEVVVRWHYIVGDDDIYEQGEALAANLEIPFKFVSHNN